MCLFLVLQVSNTEEVIALVKNNCASSRVFTLGVGSSASRHLVKGIARAASGMSLFASIGEDIRPKVVSLLKHSLQPSLHELTIKWSGVNDGNILDDSNDNIETKKTLFGYMKPKKVNSDKLLTGQAPKKIPAIFDGSRLLVYRLFANSEQPTGVIITAMTPDGPLNAEIDLENAGNIGGIFIHQLAARKMIEDLDGSTQDEYAVKRAIIELGCKYHLASKYTSFIGVDEYQKEVCHTFEKRYIQHITPYRNSVQASSLRHVDIRKSDMAHAMSSKRITMSVDWEKRFSSASSSSSVSYDIHNGKLDLCFLRYNKPKGN